MSHSTVVPVRVDGDVLVDDRPRRARLRGPLAVAGLGLAAVGYVLVVDPASDSLGQFPACPFKTATGLDCPFCGGLRAARALAGGDLATAWDRNALAVLLIPLAAVAWLVWLRRAWTGRSPAPTPARSGRTRVLWLLALAVGLLWWVLRNLPAFSAWGSGLTG